MLPGISNYIWKIHKLIQKIRGCEVRGINWKYCTELKQRKGKNKI
jgi:hypothetical protein